MSGEVMFKKRKRKNKNKANINDISNNNNDNNNNNDIKLIKKLKSNKRGLSIQSNKNINSNHQFNESFTSKRTITPAEEYSAAVIVEKRELSEADRKKPKWKVGPKALASNVRQISIMDYNPSLCKDYKETGYCGYGDACIYIHDRSDYKSGWELEKEWQKEQEEKFKKAMKDSDDDSDSDNELEDDGFPWACPICHNDFVHPIVTKCKHYFCEKCALKHYSKRKKCFTCEELTHGIFNTATQLIKVIKKRKDNGIKPPYENDSDNDNDNDDNNSDE